MLQLPFSRPVYTACGISLVTFSISRETGNAIIVLYLTKITNFSVLRNYISCQANIRDYSERGNSKKVAVERKMKPEDEERFFELVKEVVGKGRYSQLEEYIQHGDTTVYQHSLAVAYLSYWMVLKYDLKVHLEELIRGALLHDYFLYDWHEKDAGHSLHGFTHPGKALINACEDFNLPYIRSRFPCNAAVSVSAETVIVCMADKICSVYETFHMTLFGELSPV